MTPTSDAAGASAVVVIPQPIVSAAGLGGADNSAVWVSGVNFTGPCTVTLYAPDWSPATPLAVLSGADVTCSESGATFQIPASLSSQYTQLNFTVTNAGGKWSDPRLVSIANSYGASKPVVTSSGLGSEGAAGWAGGSGFSQSCVVRLFRPDWSSPEPIAVLSGGNVNCADSQISFAIPDYVRSQFESVNFNVTNSAGLWSEPVELSLK